MKDAQQVAVVDGVISNFNFPIELAASPTISDASGLAKRSRNVHLSEEELLEARWLYQALENGRQLVVDGKNNPSTIIDEVIQTIHQHTDRTIDYVELLSYPALQEVTVVDQQVILAIAVNFKQARLIDNLVFDKYGQIIERLK